MADLSTSGGQARGLGIARPAGAGTFVRQATGLVRQASTLDTFIYNTNNQNIGIGVALSPLFQRVTVGVIVSGALVYLGITWLQASRGVRVERAFQEIPPE